MDLAGEYDGLSPLVGWDAEGPYLVGGKCGSCQAVFFPNQAICPRCTDQRIEETPLSRKGKLHTYTEVSQKPPDYQGNVPYLIGRVRLSEGVFVLAQLKAEKKDLKIHMDMMLIVEAIYCDAEGKEHLGYKFKPI